MILEAMPLQENVKSLESHLRTMDAVIDPVSVRETWGQTPEDQAMAAALYGQ
jgi:hypothetical protein